VTSLLPLALRGGDGGGVKKETGRDGDEVLNRKRLPNGQPFPV